MMSSTYARVDSYFIAGNDYVHLKENLSGWLALLKQRYKQLLLLYTPLTYLAYHKRHTD